MNWAHDEQLLLNREKETEIILTEAEKHYRQAQANYEAAKRERAAWNNGIEERMKGMEQSERETSHIGDCL